MENLPKADMSVAGAAIAMALVDKLMQRGILERGDALAVLQTAQTPCATLSKGAADIVGQLHAKMTSGN